MSRCLTPTISPTIWVDAAEKHAADDDSMIEDKDPENSGGTDEDDDDDEDRPIAETIAARAARAASVRIVSLFVTVSVRLISL